MVEHVADARVPEVAPLIVELITSWQAAGSERVAQRLCFAFRKRGFRVACISLYEDHGPIRSELEAFGIPCFALNLDQRGAIAKFRLEWDLYKRLRSLRAHAVHAQHVPSLLWGVFPARIAGVENFVVTEHTDFELRRSWLLRMRTRVHARFASLVTGIHGALVDFLRVSLWMPRDRVVSIPNGIELRCAPLAKIAARNTLGLPIGCGVLVFIGRLHEHKDPATLIRSFATVVEKLPQPLCLLIVGAGDQKPLRKLADELGVADGVIFVGEVRDVMPYLAAADVFVMSSVTEGAPLALLEAMSVGLACVATSVGGIPEMLDGGAGLLVEPRNPAALAGALIRVLSDADVREALGHRAHQRVIERYDFERIVDRYLDAFQLPTNWRESHRDEEEC